MRRPMWVLVTWLAMPPGLAATVEFTSRPPGAEVWVSPPDQPALYHRGVTPCTVELTTPTPGTFTVIYRRRGFLDELRHFDPRTAGAVDVALVEATLTAWTRGRTERRVQLDALIPREHRSRHAVAFEGLPWDVSWRDEFLGPDGQAAAEVWCGYDSMGEREASWVWLHRAGHAEPGLVSRWRVEERGPTFFRPNIAFGPDGTWLAYSEAAGDRESIWLYHCDSGARIPVGRHLAGSAYMPVFSPDGRWLAYLADPVGDGQEEGTSLFICRWNGTDRRRVAEGVTQEYPAFSADARRLAYWQEPMLRTCGVAEGQAADLFEVPAPLASRDSRHYTVTRPQWSPDGAWLCFGLTVRDMRLGRLQGPFVVAANGSFSRHIAAGSPWTHEVAWLAGHGARLVVQDMPRSTLEHGITYCVDELQTPEGETLETVGEPRVVLLDPAWSPDSHRIAAVGMVGDFRHDLFVVPRESGEVRDLMRGGCGNVWGARWLANGSGLLVEAGQVGRWFREGESSHYVVSQAGDVWACADPDAVELAAGPTPVLVRLAERQLSAVLSPDREYVCLAHLGDVWLQDVLRDAEPRRLTGVGMRGFGEAWLPGGVSR